MTPARHRPGDAPRGRAVLRAGVALALAALCTIALALASWDPLRGPNYGIERGAFRDAERLAPGGSAGEPVHRVLLVGDAGAPEPEDPVLAQVGRWSAEADGRTSVLFLGDNVYPAGLRLEDRKRGEQVLLQLLRSTDAPKILLPGNHDWGARWYRASATGALARQQAFVEANAHLHARFEPQHGCPGPVAVELLERVPELPGGVTALLLDLHWWLLPEDERPVCDGIDGTSDFIAALREELRARRDENVVVAAHHPIRSGGTHGGYSRGFWRDLGMALFYRFFTMQDLIQPGYREMVALLSEVLSEHPPLAMVGGHDHSLQVLDGGDEARLVVVSGAATRVTPVTAIDGTLFAHARRGFVVFDFLAADAAPDAGTLRVLVVEVGSDTPVAAFALPLAREANDGDTLL